MDPLIVTIDGPAGSGKSSVAQRVADRIGAVFLDTGAMYRAVTFCAMNQQIPLEDRDAVLRLMDRHDFQFAAGAEAMQVQLDGSDITAAIRKPEVTARVRYIAADPQIRERLVQMQRAFARQHPHLVTEGRDQGTIVFPGAALKIYLAADIDERARRRMQQLAAQSTQADLQALKAEIAKRDESDVKRAVGPLRKAEDAVEIDTTKMALDEVVDRIVGLVEQRC